MYVIPEHKYIIVKLMEETTGVEVQKTKDAGKTIAYLNGLIDARLLLTA